MRHDDGVIELGDFALEVEHGELRDAEGHRVALRPQVLSVLQCLARSDGRVVCKDVLMQTVWPGVIVTDDSLVQCIKELRRALRDDEHRVIETEAKRGYRLVSSARSHSHDAGIASFKQDIRFATSTDGVRIAYATSGDGPPLVRAAHWMTHLEWEPQNLVYAPWIQGLSRRYRLVRYDGRGWGLSDRRALNRELDDDVRDLEAVVDAAGLQRFALFGRSQGGAIVIRYAARHPDRVSHLLIEAGYARGALRRGDKSVSPEIFEAINRLVETGWGQDNPAFRQLITSFMFPGASAEQMEAFNQLQNVACSALEAGAIRRAMSTYDASPDLERVRCPTLVMHSPRDSIVPFEEGRLIASRIAGARLEAFDSANHTPLPGEPAFEHVNRLIDDFLLAPAPVAVGRALRVVSR